MLKIRLARTGAKKTPNYRVVIMEARTPRQGRYVDIVGHFHPLTGHDAFTLDHEKVKKWLDQGAQPTEAVARLLAKAGLVEKTESPQAPEAEAPKADQ